MGGKGQRRREKNYKAAHGGGNTRLPPPPDYSSLDAVPSKLRQIMSLAGPERQRNNAKRNPDSGGADKGIHSGGGSETTGTKRKRDDQSLMTQHKEHDDEANEKKKKKKRKGKKVDDLRFETVGQTGGSQRKERKKQRLEARKKKNKKPSTDEDMDFPGREEIKFGDIVKAPLKLIVVPKAFKKIQDASHERLRLQAVDAYRKRKGWESRPGVQLPPPVTSISQFSNRLD